MYSLEEIKVVHLEITSKCQAKCPMCSRNLQGGQVNPMIELEEITLEQFKNWFPIKTTKTTKTTTPITYT